MKTKKFLALLLAMLLVLTVVMSGCNKPADTTPDDEPDTEVSTDVEDEPSEVEPDVDTGDEGGETDEGEADEIDPQEWTDTSSAIYTEVMGEFYDAYMEACKEVTDNNMRYALMAIAEAKYNEAAAGMASSSNGGAYRMTRIAPNTYGYADWNGEGSSYEDVVITNEPITLEDYNALREYWLEHKGDGTYEDHCKSYLTEKGYTFKDSMGYRYSTDPATWDPANSSRTSDGACTTLTYDPLFLWTAEAEYKPAMAESVDTSPDGLTYTFHIRPGQKWVDSQGRELGDVTADDWVAGMQHVLDCKAGLETLLSGIIVNAKEYIQGDVTDFAEVGVKALDDLTLEYKLAQPVPYFMSMLTYSIFAPLNRSYYESLGGTFGTDFETGGAGDYGVDNNSIAYCGPFLCTNWTKANIITYTINPSYWDYDNTNLKTFSYIYNDGSDTTKAYTDFIAGTTDLETLNTSTIEVAKKDGNFDTIVHTTTAGVTSYMSWINVNRMAYENYNEKGAVVSPKTDDQKEAARKALRNKHFRMALLCAIDRVGYSAQTKGEDIAALTVNNSYTPGTFVSTDAEITVSINGTPTTFPAGTYYGEIMQAQMTADGYPQKVWNPELKSSIGYDGWYNPEYAQSELAIAIEELAAEGVTIDESNPIYIDTPVNISSETGNNAANFLKQSIEAALGGKVMVNLTECVDNNQQSYTCYLCDFGYQENFDLYLGVGWGPDYADPSTYLDTFLPDYDGYMTMNMGIF